MDILKALLKEAIGMFVDDGSLAIAILTIVAIAWVSFRFEQGSLDRGDSLCGLPRSFGRECRANGTEIRASANLIEDPTQTPGEQKAMAPARRGRV
jgi:hypothetical protein